MKLKTQRRSRRVTIEMGPEDRTFPAVPLPELALKRMLVPVDFSETSRKAVQYALSFARQFNAEILLLFVVEAVPPQFEVFESAVFDVKAHEEAALQLSEWQRQLASQATIKTLVRNANSAYQEIVRIAEEDNVDLIIVGTHGRTGVSRWLIGSTAERVVRHAPCPVLVVREREHDFVAPPPGDQIRTETE